MFDKLNPDRPSKDHKSGYCWRSYGLIAKAERVLHEIVLPTDTARTRVERPMTIQFSIALVDYECLLKHIEQHSPAYRSLLAGKRHIAMNWMITCRPLDGIRMLQLAHEFCPDAVDAIRPGFSNPVVSFKSRSSSQLLIDSYSLCYEPRPRRAAICAKAFDSPVEGAATARPPPLNGGEHHKMEDTHMHKLMRSLRSDYVEDALLVTLVIIIVLAL